MVIFRMAKQLMQNTKVILELEHVFKANHEDSTSFITAAEESTSFITAADVETQM